MNRNNYPVLLIGISGVLEGATRLQKYGFLCSMKIKELQKINFYNDWIPSHFGPFSPQLASDLMTSEKMGLIKKYKVTNAYGYPVERFSLTSESFVSDFANTYPVEYKKIREIIEYYQTKTLSELLQDVYFQYPQYATSSTIKAEVGKKIYESDSYLSTQYDFPASEY